MEILFEFLFEVFGEVVMSFICYLISTFTSWMDNDQKARKYVKIILSSIFFALSCVVLGLSLEYKKGDFVLTSVAFLFVFILLNFGLFINELTKKNQLIKNSVILLKTSLCVSYAIIILWMGNKRLTDNTAIVLINISGWVSLCLLFGITVYRIRSFFINRNKNLTE